jgi:hypothetical protein
MAAEHRRPASCSRKARRMLSRAVEIAEISDRDRQSGDRSQQRQAQTWAYLISHSESPFLVALPCYRAFLSAFYNQMNIWRCGLSI